MFASGSSGGGIKKQRSQGPDREGLVTYKLLLTVVLWFAPGGFPGHAALKETWLWLHREYGIMSEELRNLGKDLMTWASECADKVRLACKHLVQLKDSQTRFVSPVVQDLLEMIVADPTEAAARLDQNLAWPELPIPPEYITAAEFQRAESKTLETPKRRRLTKKVSSASDVIFCGAYCRCPACTTNEVVAVSQDSATDDEKPLAVAFRPSPTSDTEAYDELAVVPAVRGEAVRLLKKPVKKPAAAQKDIFV